jgi:hypothetical protein
MTEKSSEKARCCRIVVQRTQRIKERPAPFWGATEFLVFFMLSEAVLVIVIQTMPSPNIYQSCDCSPRRPLFPSPRLCGEEGLGWASVSAIVILNPVGRDSLPARNFVA